MTWKWIAQIQLFEAYSTSKMNLSDDRALSPSTSSSSKSILEVEFARSTYGKLVREALYSSSPSFHVWSCILQVFFLYHRSSSSKKQSLFRRRLARASICCIFPEVRTTYRRYFECSLIRSSTIPSYSCIYRAFWLFCLLRLQFFLYSPKFLAL